MHVKARIISATPCSKWCTVFLFSFSLRAQHNVLHYIMRLLFRVLRFPPSLIGTLAVCFIFVTAFVLTYSPSARRTLNSVNLEDIQNGTLGASVST
jgi:hypothetical protein